MKNPHKISTAIVLVILGIVLGYFLFSENSVENTPLTGNIVESNLSENNSLVNFSGNFEKVNVSTNNLSSNFSNPPKDLYFYGSFVRPSEAESFLGEMNFTGENDSLGNYEPLDPREEYLEIMNFMDGFIFWKDKSLYGVEDYWATPNESLSKMKGDEEDWAIALVSLMHARNSSYECYILGNSEFNAGVICYLGDNNQFYRFSGTYFDGWGTNAGTIWGDVRSVSKEDSYQEKRVELRNFRNTFLDEVVGYCCVAKLRDKKITFAYNDREYIEFEGGEDVIDWLENFMN